MTHRGTAGALVVVAVSWDSSRPVRVVPDAVERLVDPPTRMVIFPVSASKDTSLLVIIPFKSE